MLLQGCVNTVAFTLVLLTDESPRPPRCNYGLQAQLTQRDAKRQLIRNAQDRDLYRIKAEWLWPEVHTQLFTAAQCTSPSPAVCFPSHVVVLIPKTQGKFQSSAKVKGVRLGAISCLPAPPIRSFASIYCALRANALAELWGNYISQKPMPTSILL